MLKKIALSIAALAIVASVALTAITSATALGLAGFTAYEVYTAPPAVMMVPTAPVPTQARTPSPAFKASIGRRIMLRKRRGGLAKR
ncbi:hypothetical protein HN358_00200 [Candidatus Uhrbacteria bacterium]|nr:hypothetical protein [Candidatus Uhrbacteria bacterium]MBT7717270.1 hypothetical protein [Candidatus Uhrbacteria bacterium]